MEELEEYGIDIVLLKQNIHDMKNKETFKLKELYKKWSDKSVNSPTKAGKKFKQLVEDGKISHIQLLGKDSSNQHIYQKC